MNFIPWWKVNLGKAEIEKVKVCVLGGHITQGLMTEKLEKYFARLLKVPYVVLTTNGSAALLMALIAFGIKANDEVIVPDLTFAATAQAPLLLGAKVKLVDVEPDKVTIDVNNIEKAITAKTKAIIPVHLNGRAANIIKINKIAAKHGLKVIEDAVQAFYSQNSNGYLGTQSDIGIFSLGVTKLITSVQGGFLVTRDKVVFKKLKKIRNHGLSLPVSCPADSDIFGFNFKFNDLLAGIGLSQLSKIKSKVKSLQDIYKFYEKEIKNLAYLEIVKVNLEKGELPLWVEAVSQKRDELIKILAGQFIQAKAFSPALSQLPYLQARGKKEFKNSKFFANCGLILPCGPGQKQKDLNRVVKILNSPKVKSCLGA